LISGSFDDDRAREPVILNVYDMFWTNDYTGNMGLGVYHSGQLNRRHRGSMYVAHNQGCQMVYVHTKK
jgi:hypothetical protein